MDKEKYEILLSELVALIKEKNDKIELQDYTIARLTKQVLEIEKSVKESGKPQNIERR